MASASEAATVLATTASSTGVQPGESILLQADVHPTPHQPLQGTVTETPVAQHMRSLHREWGSTTTGGGGINVI